MMKKLNLNLNFTIRLLHYFIDVYNNIKFRKKFLFALFHYRSITSRFRKPSSYFCFNLIIYSHKQEKESLFHRKTPKPTINNRINVYFQIKTRYVTLFLSTSCNSSRLRHSRGPTATLCALPCFLYKRAGKGSVLISGSVVWRHVPGYERHSPTHSNNMLFSLFFS